MLSTARLLLLLVATNLPPLQLTSAVIASPAGAQDTQSADISGKWKFVYDTEGGDRVNTANFKLEGEQVTGKFGDADVKGTFKEGALDLAFPFESDEVNMKDTLKMQGQLKNGKLTGKWQFADYSGTFVATRAD